MAAVWATGFEFNVGNSAYINSGFTVTGTIDAHDTSVNHQHPDGYGGGIASLSCNVNSSLQSPATLFEVVNTGTMNSSFYATGSFQAGRVLCEVLDQNLDAVLAVAAVETAAASKLALLHAGTTFATTGARVSAASWNRISAKWTISGSTVSGSLILNGRTVGANGSVALATGLTAAGMLWGSPTDNTTHHDHVVIWDEVSANADAAYWVQGLLPNGDDVNGSWSPNPASTDFYARIVDATDGTSLDATSATYGQFNLQNRSNIDADWTSPEVIGCTCWVQAQGDGSLQDGQPRMSLGGSTISGLTLSMASAAPGSIASVFSVTKPGGGSWLSTDLDNLGVGYSVA